MSLHLPSKKEPVSRRIHLETAWAVDTDSFLNAIPCFTSRKRAPKEIISDNGKDFVGAVNELLELVNHLDEDTTQGNEHFNSVKWHFNPSADLHFGGGPPIFNLIS